MGGFWEGFEGDLIGFWAVAAELLAVACFYLLLLTFACFGLLWLALPALAALSVPLLLRFFQQGNESNANRMPKKTNANQPNSNRIRIGS